MIVFNKFKSRGRECSAFKQIALFWRDPFALLIAALAILGTAHILVRTATYGTAVQGDSTFFLSTAHNFLAGEGWQDFRGRPLVTWPPLFPLLLAAGGWVGIDPLAAGRFINATAFGLLLLVAGGYLCSNLRARWLGVVATATIAAALPLNYWAPILLTDFLFTVLTLLALMQLASFLTRRRAAALGWAAVCTALAALTRYPGVALIGTGVLLLLVRRAPPLATRLKDASVFAAVASMPLAGVLMHNWRVSGTLTGRIGESGQSLSEGLHQIVATFHKWWVVPPNVPEGVAYLLWLAVAAVGLAGATVCLCALRMHRDGLQAEPSYVRLGPVVPFGVFALIYLAFIVAVAPFTVEFGIHSRFLLPVYVPLLLTAVVLLDRFLSIEVAGWMVAVRSGLAVLVGLATLVHSGYSARENLRLTAQAWNVGYSYERKTFNIAAWQQSETLNYLRENPIAGRVYSDEAELLWFADRTAALGKYQRLSIRWFEMLRMRRWIETEVGAHIVWFHWVYPVLSSVEIVAELADGTVFRRSAAEPYNVDQFIHQADEQVSRAGWHVYRTGRRLIYRKQPCAPADVQAKFVLHVVPVDPADLPAHRKQYGSENLDFYFNQFCYRVDDECTVIVRLPAYPIRRIHIGQWISAEDRTLWEAEFAPGR